MVNGYAPKTLAEALELRSKYDLVPYAGGTDLMVGNRPNVSYLFLGKLAELKGISEDAEFVRIGAAVTYTEALSSPMVPQLMKEAISRIAAPAIRNAGPFGGNLGNGKALEKNHLYMVTISTRSVSAGSETVKLLVRGPYTIQ